jgi:hypothetical protein
MNRIAVFTMLVALSVSWSIPAKAQHTGAVEYARKSGKLNKKAAKEQRKASKKFAKAQRREAKKGNRHGTYRTPPRARFWVTGLEHSSPSSKPQRKPSVRAISEN